MHPLVLNVDTSRISRIASRAGPEEETVIDLLERGHATIALSLFQILELAHPDFAGRKQVCRFLRAVPHVIANPFQDVGEGEIEFVCAKLAGKTPIPPRVFAKSLADWGEVPGPAGGTAADLIEGFSKSPSLREAIIAESNRGAAISMLKTDSVIVREPLLPLTLEVGHYLERRRQTEPSYGEGLTAESVVRASGGTAAFPAMEVHQRIVIVRLRQLKQQSTGNDVRDEWIAFYAPYCAVSVLDRKTVNRIWAAKLACAPRTTSSLRDVPTILERVRIGELPIVQHRM